MKERKYFAWILGATLLCVIFTFVSLYEENHSHPSIKTIPSKEDIHEAKNSYILATGVVEASNGNIAITSAQPRVVEKINVTVGEQVPSGHLLLELQNRDLQSDLNAKLIDYAIARVEMEKLQSLPREEDLKLAESKVEIASITLDQAKKQYDRVKELKDPKALSLQEIDHYRYNFEQAEAQFKEAKLALDKVKNGPTSLEREMAALRIQESQAAISHIQALIDETIIRSPINGEILQIKIHVGEIPTAMPNNAPLMILGNTQEFLLKVSLNQFDASYFDPASEAVATLRGNHQFEYPLIFENIEPLMVNKQNFTHDITDTVDTRVLQIYYRIKHEKGPLLYVGQQMDVKINLNSKIP